MKRRKFVIPVPADPLAVAERAARDVEITRSLNVIFDTPGFAKRHSREVSELDSVGTDWSDERW